MTIHAYGTYGSLEIDPVTGRVVSHQGVDYADIHSVDLNERRDFYLRHGVDIGFPQPDGDILDFDLITVTGRLDPAVEDYRGEILLCHYGREL